MENKKNEGLSLFFNLSRKELQSMCKMYGLPANKSHSDLEKSLVAYREEGSSHSMNNSLKASHHQYTGSESNEREVLRSCSSESRLSSLRNGLVEVIPKLKRRDMGNAACSAENAFPSSIKYSPIAPSSSFEFYVSSDEGINLYVNLNSSPSEWAQKFKNEIRMCENVPSNTSWNPHQDLHCLEEGEKEVGTSSMWNLDACQMEEGQTQRKYFPISKMTRNDDLQLDTPDKDGESLISSVLLPCSVDVSDLVKEDQAPKSSELNPTSQSTMLSVAESCEKDGSTVVNDTDIIDAPHIHSVCGSFALQHQVSNHDWCQDSTLQNGCSFINPTLINSGCSVSGSIEMQSSEVAICHKDALDLSSAYVEVKSLVDPKHTTVRVGDGLANSSKINEINPGLCSSNFQMSIEEWEKENIINGRESSECSQLTGSSTRTCCSYDDLRSNELLKRKRKDFEGEHQHCCSRPDAKIIRSLKHKAREELGKRSTLPMFK